MSELATQMFLVNDVVTVKGIVIAGYAQFKDELAESTMLDARLRGKVLSVIDVAYGGTQGLHQAIELSAGDLAHVKLVQEQQVLQRFFDEIAHSEDAARYCFGPREVEAALHAGVVNTLMLHDKIRLYRHVLRTADHKEHVIYTANEVLAPRDYPKRVEAAGAEVIASEELIQYLIDEAPRHGARIELVTDRSTLGSQFARGFGGVGAMLRYSWRGADEEEEAIVEEDIAEFDDLV